jgi:hypothetical protein
VNIVAGLFILVFGGLGAWLLAVRFPSARFLRTGYICMGLGGLVFAVWSIVHAVALGVIGIVLLLAGGISGAIGALRKEVRLLPPG